MVHVTRFAAVVLAVLAVAAPARAQEPLIPAPVPPAPKPDEPTGPTGATKVEPPANVAAREPWMVWRMAIKSRRTTKHVTRIAIVADGYAADPTEASLQAARSQFVSDAKALVNAVENDPAGWELLRHRNLEFTFVFKSSRQKATIAGTTTTNFGARVVDGFLRLGREGSVVAALSFAAKGLAPDATVTLVKFADPEAWLDVRANAERVGKQGFVRMVAGHASVFVHELGHALFNLGDEYGFDFARRPTSGEAKWIERYPNLSLDGQTTKWRYWTATKPIEGGARFAKGVWHAEAKCRMNQCDSEAFCVYCRALIDTHYAILDERAFHDRMPAPISLHNASIPTKKVYSEVLLQDVKGQGYVDRVVVAPGQKFTLRWSLAGVAAPPKWTFEFQRGDLVHAVEVDGLATRREFGGLSNDTREKVSWMVWVRASSRPDVRHLFGYVSVLPR